LCGTTGIYSYISKQAIVYPITKILVASEKFLVETCGNPIATAGASPWCSKVLSWKNHRKMRSKKEKVHDFPANHQHF